MTEQFNPKVLFDNVDFLIKSENRKIGEVESDAGVSAGYISRTSKDGGSRPGIDFIMNIAKVLHVSIDTLLKVDISSLTPTERYLISFLKKLEHDTVHDLLAWERVSAESLNNMETDQNGITIIHYLIFIVSMKRERASTRKRFQESYLFQIRSVFILRFMGIVSN